ncbi:unnamed protein product [Rhizopus stolonifer]
MSQKHAASVYSQKSSRSMRSFSLGHSSISTVREYFKSWMPFKKDTADFIDTPPTTAVTVAANSIHSSTETVTTKGPVGILVDLEKESAQERKERRKKRRESSIQYYHSIDTSSSDTLFEQRISFKDINDDDDPRIFFVTSSPVPRFRNSAPTPPSPPYMNIHIQPDNDDTISIIQNLDGTPTVFTEKEPPRPPVPFLSEYERRIQLLKQSTEPPPKHTLVFKKPYFRGQTLKFSLHNPLPEDHIVLFKFMTSNRDQTERFMIRPSAGKLDSLEEAEIRLFLNKAPQHNKDKIIIRWAVVQKNSEIERWVNEHLNESTKRRWIDLLDETWKDQVLLKLTRIKVDFI